MIKSTEKEIRDRLGSYIYGVDEDTLESNLAHLLTEHSLTISTGESCTGGLIAHTITNVPGSSNYFMGGVVAYSNKAKTEILDVSQRTLKNHGAVSNQVAVQMARGARRVFKTDIGLSTTGIAGPGGGTESKPVGLTYVGLIINDKIYREKFNFSGDRKGNKIRTTQHALKFLLDKLG